MKTVRLRIFTKGFRLLQLLVRGPLSRDEACAELRMHPREWYRWLAVFRSIRIPLAEDYRLQVR